MEGFHWTVEMEVALFHAIHEHRPIGVNRHFEMLLIQDKLNNSSKRKISTADIWSHLRTMYDLQALNESETIPFPNVETDFNLPDDQYDELREQSYPRKSTSVDLNLDKESSSLASDMSFDRQISKSSKSSNSGEAGEKSDKSESVKGSDGRKRTRQSISTPVANSPLPVAGASSAENTPTNKRSRRI